MTKKQSNILPIVVMYLLFFMIAFVTNLCNPMAVIVKNNFAMSNFASQLGNAANFIAYAVMGIPAGMLLKKIGYRKTALVAILVGFVGVFLQYMSGWAAIQSFWVYFLSRVIALVGSSVLISIYIIGRLSSILKVSMVLSHLRTSLSGYTMHSASLLSRILPSTEMV